MPHGLIVYLTFPTVRGLWPSCLSFVTTCPEEVHPRAHATWRLMGAVSAAHLPDADIVYDRFHPMMNVNQAVDEVRRSQWRQAKSDQRQVFKGHRFLILKNQDSLDWDSRQKLNDLLAANQSLATAYLLKEQFRSLFFYRRQGWAQRALRNWCQLAEQSGLAPCRRLAKSFTKHAKRVFGYVKHGLTSGLIEGFSKLVSRIIHKANGIRDLDYLELKLRHHSVMRS